MYEVTQSERDMYKQTGSVKRGYIDIIPLSDTEETIILDEYDIKDFTILDDIYTPEQGIIGSIIAKQLTLNLFKPTDIDLTNREINVFIGVDILENGEWITKYIPFGTFIIQKPDNEEITDKTSFDAFDFMVKFNLPFEDTLTYPCTIKDVLNAICEQCGVELATTSFANENFVVENNQFVNGESCRDVLKAIAQISGSFARIGRDNKLYLGFLNPENYETFDDTDYNKDIKINNTFGPVNRLVLRMSQVEGENVVVQDNESISQIGIKELVISDNPFTYTQEKRENAITEIWNKVKGLTYIDYDMKVIPRPYMDVGDSVKILTQDNVQYNSYLFTHELNYTGGLSGNMTATADTETETKYAFIPQLSTRMRHTEIIVDKHTGQITQIVEEQGEYDTKLSQITQDIDSINQKLQNVMDFTRTQSGKGFLHLNDCEEGTGYIIELSIRDVNYLTPSETLTPSEILVPFGDYFTLVIDRAIKENKTDDAFELRIDLDKSLLRLDDNTYDEILINDTGDINLIRRVGKDEKGFLYKLEVETTETLGNVMLPTFEPDTYIYVKENSNINFYTKWIIKSDLSDVYATKVELSSTITQTTTSIMSEVNKKVNDTDFGTKIIQDFESVQIAWNQISQYIKMLGESGKASLAIFDENNYKLMNLDQNGQEFFKTDGKRVGRIGIVREKNNSDILAFIMDIDWEQQNQGSSMAWGYNDKNGNFLPIFYLEGSYGAEQSGYGGNISLVGNLIASQSRILTSGGDNPSGEIYMDDPGGIQILGHDNDITLIADRTLFLSGAKIVIDGTITTDLISRHNYGDKYYEGYNVIEMTKEHKVMTSYSSNTGTIAFYADENFIDSIGMNISDKRLKYDFKNIDEKILKAIEDIEIQQFKFIDTDNKIHFGIIAQDLIEIFNKYEINPEEYDILKSFKRKVSDDTTYYKIEYTQFLVLKQLATDYKIKKQQEEIDDLKEKINLLLKERSVNNGQNNI